MHDLSVIGYVTLYVGLLVAMFSKHVRIGLIVAILSLAITAIKQWSPLLVDYIQIVILLWAIATYLYNFNYKNNKTIMPKERLALGGMLTLVGLLEFWSTGFALFGAIGVVALVVAYWLERKKRLH